MVLHITNISEITVYVNGIGAESKIFYCQIRIVFQPNQQGCYQIPQIRIDADLIIQCRFQMQNLILARVASILSTILSFFTFFSQKQSDTSQGFPNDVSNIFVKISASLFQASVDFLFA